MACTRQVIERVKRFTRRRIPRSLFPVSLSRASGIVRSGLKVTRSAVNAAFDLNKT